jgi:hypothetical protein
MTAAKRETRIVGYIDSHKAEFKDAPLWWHEEGRQYSASGYGRKIPTARKVKHGGKWRRVYVCQYSNAGTAYIVQGRDWIVVR